jgi:glycosyltransferase involved in cell wall biosynthesis
LQLTALVESVDHVCCRYRLLAFQPYLEQAGHRLHLHSIPSAWWSRLRLFRSLGANDAVILQRKLLRPWQLAFLRRAVPKLIYDFDDAVFLRDSYACKGLSSRDRLRRFDATLRAADAVAAGNAFLRNEALACFQIPAKANAISIIPTCIDPDHYLPAPHRHAGAGVKLVWIGSSSTLQGLERFAPTLEYVGRYWPELSLHVVCDRFLHLRYLPVIPRPWSQQTEAADLAAADIGISWLPDDAWSRGKCGLKILQYMAAGLPVVANPVGVQAEMVRHGETGFLVQTQADWCQAIGRLAHEPELRRAMGNAGRLRVEQYYSVRAGAARWLSLLNVLQAQRGAA